MSRTIYDPDIDADLDPGTIEARLRQDGWDPVLISDEAGYVYPHIPTPQPNCWPLLTAVSTWLWQVRRINVGLEIGSL